MRRRLRVAVLAALATVVLLPAASDAQLLSSTRIDRPPPGQARPNDVGVIRITGTAAAPQSQLTLDPLSGQPGGCKVLTQVVGSNPRFTFEVPRPELECNGTYRATVRSFGGLLGIGSGADAIDVTVQNPQPPAGTPLPPPPPPFDPDTGGAPNPGDAPPENTAPETTAPPPTPSTAPPNTQVRPRRSFQPRGSVAPPMFGDEGSGNQSGGPRPPATNPAAEPGGFDPNLPFRGQDEPEVAQALPPRDDLDQENRIVERDVDQPGSGVLVPAAVALLLGAVAFQLRSLTKRASRPAPVAVDTTIDDGPEATPDAEDHRRAVSDLLDRLSLPLRSGSRDNRPEMPGQ